MPPASFPGFRERRRRSCIARQPALAHPRGRDHRVYIILGVLYESYIHPITILSTLPSAGVGAILALIICRTELDVVALIGMILLIGIVAKNAIMMIDFALDAERKGRQTPRATPSFRPVCCGSGPS